jgi:hypothetical protein
MYMSGTNQRNHSRKLSVSLGIVTYAGYSVIVTTDYLVYIVTIFIFPGLVTVGMLSQWSRGIIMDDLNVCQNRFCNPTPVPVHELVAIYRSISPTLDSFRNRY